MLINPSPLLGLRPERMQYVRITPIREYLDIICEKCCPKMPCTWLGGPATVQIEYQRTTLKVERIRIGEKRATIWHGSCERCKTWYWTCRDFGWVAWLTDLQVASMVMTGIPIRHVQLDGKVEGQAAIIVEKTCAYFVCGKVVEIR